MQFYTLLPLALAAMVSAQTTSTSVDPAPQTTLLTETNSNGVVTGQPSQLVAVTTQPGVVTTQPEAVTTQPSAALLPAGFSGVTTLIYGNTSYTYSVGNGVTSLVQSTPTPTAQSTAGGSASGSAASASSSSKSNSAAGTHLKAGVGALAAAGGFFAVFL